MVPARNMSCAISACSSSGPTVGRLSTSETMMLPGDEYGKQIADGADERVERDAHRVLQMTRRSGRPLARAVTT